MPSSSRDADQIEYQNDQRLDELTSKIRTLRGVTSDIHQDVERQHLTLDETSNSFTSLGTSLAQSSHRAARAFGINGGVKQWRNILTCVGIIIGFWFAWKLFRPCELRRDLCDTKLRISIGFQELFEIVSYVDRIPFSPSSASDTFL
ncbi:protein related to Bet1 -Laccaria bicolor [Pyrrhoderma noxium]|uniref:Protein related to Bet1-Laccaria bicolor n=1 Tax=Pyrrhoderma noxium TaxID=2282107 RepID=A0A286UV16_9AGAM|nr:protein related to Bet1 -Laccaria bicolor [Pyrrhoderma noxium]